jgi:hypothetical protein
MNVAERATQIWPLLAWASHNRQTLTYELLGRLVGVPPQALGQLLEPIQSYCLSKRLEPLTALVVSQVSGEPGAGFIAAADVPKAQQRIFKYDWIGHGCPSTTDFDIAVKTMPSNG